MDSLVICCDNGHIFSPLWNRIFIIPPPPPIPLPDPRSNNDGNWITLLPAKNSISLLHYIANKTFFHAFFCLFHFFPPFFSFFFFFSERSDQHRQLVFRHFLLYMYFPFSLLFYNTFINKGKMILIDKIRFCDYIRISNIIHVLY